MKSIRLAVENDIDALCSFDLVAQHENERREFIRRNITSGNCFIAVKDKKVMEY